MKSKVIMFPHNGQGVGQSLHDPHAIPQEVNLHLGYSDSELTQAVGRLPTTYPRPDNAQQCIGRAFRNQTVTVEHYSMAVECKIAKRIKAKLRILHDLKDLDYSDLIT